MKINWDKYRSADSTWHVVSASYSSVSHWVMEWSSWFKELCHACCSRTVPSCRQGAGGCALRQCLHLFAMWPPTLMEQRDRRSCSAAPGEQKACTRLVLSLLSILGAGRDPAASSPQSNPYRESGYTTQFHPASTWQLLFFSRASCFLSYQALFMLKLGKMHLHSRRALPSWQVSASRFHPTWLKLAVWGNKQARPKRGQTGCVPTQGVASIKESPICSTSLSPNDSVWHGQEEQGKSGQRE